MRELAQLYPIKQVTFEEFFLNFVKTLKHETMMKLCDLSLMIFNQPYTLLQDAVCSRTAIRPFVEKAGIRAEERPLLLPLKIKGLPKWLRGSIGKTKAVGPTRGEEY